MDTVNLKFGSEAIGFTIKPYGVPPPPPEIPWWLLLIIPAGIVFAGVIYLATRKRGRM